jgi:hemoglobin
MKAAHMGMGISGADFDALVQDLVGALDKFKVGQHEKDQLLGALGPMKTDIVEKK